MEQHSVYIITNKPKGVLYIGITKDLKRRIRQHKNKVHPTTFSARYNLNVLVYFEHHETKESALLREKRMKKWNRDWKVELIEKENPNWEDLVSKIK
ncbi:GIY-YIG nuclease family protein [Kordia sp.]|uniref:GIY-YIG nuclease family protein n=1 Tax=Kordia sp. TaxID=1965332 RepID=UPI003D28931E